MSEIDVRGCCHNNSNGENGICEIYKVRCYQRYCYYKQLQQLKAENEKLREELKSVENDRKWIKEKCIDAGKELGKYSFAWDGKEKNLVVQAMQLNEMYEKLKAENDELRARNGRGMLAFLEEDFKKEQKIKKYKQCLDEIEEICQNETINLTDSCVNGGRYFEILQLIKQAKDGD